MKVLIDSCVAKSVGAALATAGHEVESVAEWPADPGDAVIMDEAHLAGRVIVTLDKDFGELAVVRGHTHSGIVRLVGLTTAQQTVVAVAAFARYGDELARGAIVTADAGRTRCACAFLSAEEERWRRALASEPATWDRSLLRAGAASG